MRKLLAAAVLAGSLVVAGGSAAHAADDPGTKASRHVIECVHEAYEENGLLEESIDVEELSKSKIEDVDAAIEDCKKAPSLITPATSEIIWGGLAFLIVLVVLVKFAFPALKKGMAAREERIRSDLESAERSREEAQAEKQRYDAQLGDARAEANRIVEEARQDAERVRADLITRAEADAAEVRTRAQDDIRLASERAMSDLTHHVTDLSIELAEKIVERNLDRDTQAALVESFISSVGSGKK